MLDSSRGGDEAAAVAGEELGGEASDVGVFGVAVVFEESCVGDESPAAGPRGPAADAEPAPGPVCGAGDEGCAIALADPLAEQEHDGRNGDGDLLSLREEQNHGSELTG